MHLDRITFATFFKKKVLPDLTYIFINTHLFNYKVKSPVTGVNGSISKSTHIGRGSV